MTRLVEPIVEPNFHTVWIGTNPSLRKVKEIRNNAMVTLAFGDIRAHANIVLYGEATIKTDTELRRRYWRGQWRMFFPDGPRGVDYVLIKIRPQRMEIMDFARNIVQEPFGLKPVTLAFENGEWHEVAEES